MKRICLKCGKNFEGMPSEIHCTDCIRIIKSDTRRIKKCIDCGVEFVGQISSLRCPECNGYRKIELRRISKQRAKNGQARKMGSIGYCVTCGAPYTVCNSGQKYCTECSTRERKKNNSKSAMKRMKENNYSDIIQEHRREATPLINCPVCGKSFNPYPSKTACSDECFNILFNRNIRIA